MIYYLIDYENTGENGLRGITELGENSCVVIFYSENADKLSFDMHQKLMECRAAVEYRKISTGKRNALDFQLSTYLGYLIAKGDKDEFYIVSKDNGYRAVIDFWRDKGVHQIEKIAISIPRTERQLPAAFMPEPVVEKTVETAAEPEAERVAGAGAEPVAESAVEAGAEQAVQSVEKPVETAKVVESAVTSPAEVVVTKPAETAAMQAAEVETAKQAAQPVKEMTEPAHEAAAPVEPEAQAEPEPVKAGEPEKQEKEEAPVHEDKKPLAVRHPEVFRRRGPRQESGKPETAKQDTTKPEPAKQQSAKPAPLSPKELREQVAQVISDEEEQENICRFITKYKTKQGVNNAIMKLYGSEKAGELYKKIKPLLKDKKGK